MKHILCILLVTLLLLCTGCTNRANSPKEAPDNPSAATAPDPADSPKETPNSLPAATQDDTEPVPQQAEFADPSAQVTSEKQKSKHLQGDFSGMKEAALVEMQFEELTDENGEMYLRYLSINETGSAQPPYTVG